MRTVVSMLGCYKTTRADVTMPENNQIAIKLVAQIGIIAELGREAGVDTPLIRRLVELIHDIEDGKRQRSLSTFNILSDACRSRSTAA